MKNVIAILSITLFPFSALQADSFEAGIGIQRTIVEDVEMNQTDGDGNTQALNNMEIESTLAGAVQTHEGDDIDMQQTGGRNSTQAVNNVVIDGAFAGSYQSVTADWARLKQNGGSGNTQALNNAKIK